MPTIHQRRAARNDLVDQFVYLAENADLETAERFLANAETTFNDLASQPGMGATVSLRDPTLAGMRRWAIQGFRNHLVFYLPLPEGISIVRVLHASRDWWSVLGVET